MTLGNLSAGFGNQQELSQWGMSQKGSPYNGMKTLG
jgi:hypothetical protein